METVDNTEAEGHASVEGATAWVSLWKIITISIFAFALNLHWSAIGVIILPSQIYKMVGPLQQGEALALVLVPGAFASLIANPLFGFLSDNMHGRLARWGKRRPYIFIGSLLNIVGLFWLAVAPNVPSLAAAYVLTQLASNAAQAPFHALLPDIVPQQQRGLTSGIIGLMTIVGNIAGVLLAGIFINANKPLTAYQQSLWLTYGIIAVVLIAFMLITVFTVSEREVKAPEIKKEGHFWPPTWLTTGLARTLGGTILGVGLMWGIVEIWNLVRPAGIVISGDILQVLLEIVATIGLLRIFDFHPRRYPDFSWVLITRFLMMLGIYTIQTYLQYYMRDVVHASQPELQTTRFTIVVALTSLISALGVGWLSDHYGRKRMVYISGTFMALVGLVFVITHDLVLVTISGAIFGLGYGAYVSVDWALVADVLPSKSNFARDMGVWNISLSLPQVIAPVLGGPLLDHFAQTGQTVLGYQILFGLAIVYCLISTVAMRYVRGVR